MAGKKQGKGLQTPSVNIRSRTSSGFNVLDCLEENFPILHTGKPGNLPASGNALEEPAVVVKQVANFGDLNATPMSAGKQGNGIEKQLNAAGAVLTAGTPAEPATSVKVTSPTAAIQIGGAAVKTKQPPAAQPDLEPNSIAAGKTPGNAGSETTLLPGDKTSSSPTKPADTTAKKASPAMGSSAETSAANPGKATTRTNTQWSELFRDNRAPSKGGVTKRMNGKVDIHAKSGIDPQNPSRAEPTFQEQASASPTGQPARPTRPLSIDQDAAASPTGIPPSPTGPIDQRTVFSAKPAANLSEPAPTALGPSNIVQGAAEISRASKDDEAILEDIERIVIHEKDLKVNDVVVKYGIAKDKFCFAVKPLKFVHADVIRVDTSLRLTDNLDGRGLTFLAKCLEKIPGVTRNKGEVFFDPKFTIPFRAFFGI
ncbi:unnamed protein product [Cuscuta europaea]|uniref:Uncharacterized protein n=1 Tax=Cuscuta europaea TaxID=41803 RepID=A0A9P1E6T8_CUSEU|nr:unnamed protein product [Cuscuta europaea]